MGLAEPAWPLHRLHSRDAPVPMAPQPLPGSLFRSAARRSSVRLSAPVQSFPEMQADEPPAVWTPPSSVHLAQSRWTGRSKFLIASSHLPAKARSLFQPRSRAPTEWPSRSMRSLAVAQQHSAEPPGHPATQRAKTPSPSRCAPAQTPRSPAPAQCRTRGVEGNSWSDSLLQYLRRAPAPWVHRPPPTGLPASAPQASPPAQAQRVQALELVPAPSRLVQALRPLVPVPRPCGLEISLADAETPLCDPLLRRDGPAAAPTVPVQPPLPSLLL